MTRLEKQQQTLESQLQQAKALSAQSAQALADHQQQPPAGLDPTCTAEQLAQRLAQLAQQLRENTTRREIRQQIKQDADNRQRQRALMAEMKQASQQVEDWGYLNALIGSKEGDKFRKFARGLTLDNLVWLANHQLTRLHGRYLLQRKASDALELEVVDTAGRRRARYANVIRRRKFLVSWRWRWRYQIWSAIKRALILCSSTKASARLIAKRWTPRWMRSTR